MPIKPPPGYVDIVPMIESVATEEGRQYIADLRKKRGSSEPFSDVELEEIIVKAYSMGFVAAVRLTEEVGRIVQVANRAVDKGKRDT